MALLILTLIGLGLATGFLYMGLTFVLLVLSPIILLGIICRIIGGKPKK